MLTRKFRLTMVCMSAALYPAISGAWPAQRSLDACVNAFKKTLATPALATRSYKVVFRGDHDSGSILGPFYSPAYSFELHANDPKTGATFGHVRCEVNRIGVVTALIQMPLQSNKEPTVRVTAGGARMSAY
jgi:hypothetical protein